MIGSAVMAWWGIRSTFLVTAGLLIMTAVFAASLLPADIRES